MKGDVTHRPTEAGAAVRIVRLNVNGPLREARVALRTTLLDTLREHLQMTGTQKGEDRAGGSGSGL